MLTKNRQEIGAIETGQENHSDPRILSCRKGGTWYLIPGTITSIKKP